MPRDRNVPRRPRTGGVGADGIPGRPTGFSSARCEGVLGEVADGRMVTLRCGTGHEVALETLPEDRAAHVGDAPWAAGAATRAGLTQRGGEEASRHRREAHAAERRATVVRDGDDGQHPQGG